MVSVTGASADEQTRPGRPAELDVPVLGHGPVDVRLPDGGVRSGRDRGQRDFDEHEPPRRTGPPGPGRARPRPATGRTGAARVRKPIEPCRDEHARIRRRTDQSERAGVEPARSGPRRRDPQPIQASGMTISAQPSASMSPSGRVERLLAGRGVLEPERRVTAVRTRDARQRLKTGGSSTWILPSTRVTRAEPNGPATGSSSRLQPAHRRARLARRRSAPRAGRPGVPGWAPTASRRTDRRSAGPPRLR